MDSTVQQADDESSISQGTSALQVETGIPGDDGGKKQILNQSSWIVTHELGPDGELLLLPMRQASPTAVSITMQPTASVAEEAVAVSIKYNTNEWAPGCAASDRQWPTLLYFSYIV